MVSVKEFSNKTTERLKQDKDLVIAVTGNEGDGKSALANSIGLAGDSLFSMSSNILYSPNVQEMKNKVSSLPKFSFIVADEAIKILYKLNWASRGQKFINEMYAVCRKENKCSILCIPRFSDLNEYFRNHRVKIWVHIIEPISNEKSTGRAIIFMPSWSPFAKDPWWFKENQKIIDDYSKRYRLTESNYTPDKKIDLLSQLKNYVDVLEFNWINNDLWQQYLENKSKVTYSEESTVSEIRDKRSEKLNQRIQLGVKNLLAKGMNMPEIASIFGITVARVSQINSKSFDEDT